MFSFFTFSAFSFSLRLCSFWFASAILLLSACCASISSRSNTGPSSSSNTLFRSEFWERAASSSGDLTVSGPKPRSGVLSKPLPYRAIYAKRNIFIIFCEN